MRQTWQTRPVWNSSVSSLKCVYRSYTVPIHFVGIYFKMANSPFSFDIKFNLHYLSEVIKILFCEYCKKYAKFLIAHHVTFNFQILFKLFYYLWQARLYFKAPIAMILPPNDSLEFLLYYKVCWQKVLVSINFAGFYY